MASKQESGESTDPTLGARGGLTEDAFAETRKIEEDAIKEREAAAAKYSADLPEPTEEVGGREADLATISTGPAPARARETKDKAEVRSEIESKVSGKAKDDTPADG